MMEYFARVLIWWLIAVGKFLVTPFLMIFNNEWYHSGEHWSWLETVLVASSGAASGSVRVLSFRPQYIFAWLAHHMGKNKRIFTPWRRRIIRLKWKYGIKGLMLVSGFDFRACCFICLAAKFYRHDNNALPLMITGFFIWAIVLTSIAFAGKLILY
jgi:hypothetical protein